MQRMGSELQLRHSAATHGALAPEETLLRKPARQVLSHANMILEDLQHRYELLKPRLTLVRSFL